MGPIHLEAFILANEIDLNKTIGRSPIGHNITHDENTALNSLLNNHDIVIKPADKGGAIVILNRADYIAEGERQLSDLGFYNPLDLDPTESNNQRINLFINSLSLTNEITPSHERKLLTLEARTPTQTLGFEKYRRAINSSPQAMQEPILNMKLILNMNLKCHGGRQ